ncbi:MAG: hypothetical protein AB1384_07785 [Actinomycetota bacterium]
MILVASGVLLLPASAHAQVTVPPTVSASPALYLHTTATLNGQITDTGGENADQRGFRWRAQGESVWQEWNENAGPYGTGSYSHDLSGLDPGRTYEFYARAHNSAGWGESAALIFSTTPFAPVPRTDPATDVTPYVATLNGYITYTGGYETVVDNRGFAWRASGTSTWQVYEEGPGSFGIGAFSHIITGLSPSTTYEFFAFAENSAAWTGTLPLTFTTGTVAPTVATWPATGVTVSSATLHGEITDRGSEDCDQRGFRWRLQGTSVWDEFLEDTGPYGEGSFSLELFGIFPGTTYEFQARAHNSAGWSEGDTLTFTTPPLPYAFYFAEGCTGEGFQEYLCLGQPDDAPVAVTVTYLFNDGGTPLVMTYNVPAHSRLTVDVNAKVGAGEEVSIICESAFPFVAERLVYFDYTGAGENWTGGHDVVGAATPAPTWYFAEGYTGPGFDEYICVLNPGDDPADLAFRFQTQEEGEIVVTGESVPARSRRTFKVNQLLEGKGFQTSLALESSQPVVAERPMYFDYLGPDAAVPRHWTGGHCVMGATELASEYFFAEGTTRSGFEQYLTLQNPGQTDISVHAVYMPDTGGTMEADYRVPASERATVYVPQEVGEGRDVSVRLTCSEPFLAERPLYFDYTGTGDWHWTGGHCVIGATGAAATWFFAEGYTGAGFEEWICIQNPGDETAEVTITYFPEGGGAPIVREQPVIAANSRSTVYVNHDAGPGLSISAMITSDEPVICERPMYFSFGPGGWTGGHDVLGFVP